MPKWYSIAVVYLRIWNSFFTLYHLGKKIYKIASSLLMSHEHPYLGTPNTAELFFNDV